MVPSFGHAAGLQRLLRLAVLHLEHDASASIQGQTGIVVGIRDEVKQTTVLGERTGSSAHPYRIRSIRKAAGRDGQAQIVRHPVQQQRILAGTILRGLGGQARRVADHAVQLVLGHVTCRRLKFVARYQSFLVGKGSADGNRPCRTVLRIVNALHSIIISMTGTRRVVQETVGLNAPSYDVIRDFPPLVLLAAKHDIPVEILVLDIGIPGKKHRMAARCGDEVDGCLRGIRLAGGVNGQEFPQLMILRSAGAQRHGSIVRRASAGCFEIQARLVVPDSIVPVPCIFERPALVLCFRHRIDADRAAHLDLEASRLHVHFGIPDAVDIVARKVARIVRQVLQRPLLIGIAPVVIQHDGGRVVR